MDKNHQSMPDETTICKFRHLLEAHQLEEQLFARIREYLVVQAMQSTGAPSWMPPSPQRPGRQKIEQAPAPRQTKKSNPWYFGMKAHFGVDSRTKLIHSVAATAANGHDTTSAVQAASPAIPWVWG